MAEEKQEANPQVTDTSSFDKAPPAYQHDPLFFRNVAHWLGLTITLSIVAVSVLVWQEAAVPDGLIAIGSAAVGAMASVFRVGG